MSFRTTWSRYGTWCSAAVAARSAGCCSARGEMPFSWKLASGTVTRPLEVGLGLYVVQRHFLGRVYRAEVGTARVHRRLYLCRREPRAALLAGALDDGVETVFLEVHGLDSTRVPSGGPRRA